MNPTELHDQILQSLLEEEPIPEDLARAAARLIARDWQRTGTSALTFRHYAALSKLAKRLAQMTSLDDTAPQQLRKYAQKTLRGLRANKLTASQLRDRCKQFKRLRKTIIRNSPAATSSISLAPLPMTARWLTPRNFRAVGQQMRNCLANLDNANFYKQFVDDEVARLMTIEDADGAIQVLLRVDTEIPSVSECAGPSRSRPIAAREALIAVLLDQNIRVWTCTALHELGICDELLAARANRAGHNFTIDGRDCEVGAGFVVIARGDNTILLRGGENYRDVCTIAPQTDASGYIAGAVARVWLRAACRAHPAFATACTQAFPTAPPTFLADWFDSPWP